VNTLHNNEPGKPPNCGQCGVVLPVGSKFCNFSDNVQQEGG